MHSCVAKPDSLGFSASPPLNPCREHAKSLSWVCQKTSLLTLNCHIWLFSIGNIPLLGLLPGDHILMFVASRKDLKHLRVFHIHYWDAATKRHDSESEQLHVQSHLIIGKCCGIILWKEHLKGNAQGPAHCIYSTLGKNDSKLTANKAVV